jgi:hypothetical protein
MQFHYQQFQLPDNTSITVQGLPIFSTEPGRFGWVQMRYKHPDADSWVNHVEMSAQEWMVYCEDIRGLGYPSLIWKVDMETLGERAPWIVDVLRAQWSEAQWLGRGNDGVAYKVIWPDGGYVVVKTYSHAPANLANTWVLTQREVVKKFAQELSAYLELSANPKFQNRLATIYDFRTIENRYFLTLEYCETGILDQDSFEYLAETIQFMHQAGWTYGDPHSLGWGFNSKGYPVIYDLGFTRPFHGMSKQGQLDRRADDRDLIKRLAKEWKCDLSKTWIGRIKVARQTRNRKILSRVP